MSKVGPDSPNDKSNADVSANQPLNVAVPGTVDSHKAAIKKIAAGKPVTPSTYAAKWISFLLFWPFLPIHLTMMIIGGLCCTCVWACFTGWSRRTWFLQRARPFNARPPLWAYWNTLWSHMSSMLVFIKMKGRLGLFMAGRDQLGGGRQH